MLLLTSSHLEGPDGNPRALSYTKRSNPASLATSWLGPGGGQGGGPGIPGDIGNQGSLQHLCLEECECSTSGKPDSGEYCGLNGPCPVCTDTNCVGGCEVCSPSFNNKLTSNKTLVRLWCDPADPACKNNEPTRAPKNVRVLADFVPGSPTNVKWTDHNSNPPTSNLTIINPPHPRSRQQNQLCHHRRRFGLLRLRGRRRCSEASRRPRPNHLRWCHRGWQQQQLAKMDCVQEQGLQLC